MFINNNARLYVQEKVKTKNYTDANLKIELDGDSNGETESDIDNDFNDKTEYDIIMTNKFRKNILIQ